MAVSPRPVKPGTPAVPGLDQGRMVLCAYSRPLASELQRRFIAPAAAAGCPGDLSRVRAGAIHSLCRRILPFHGRRGGPRTDFTVLNGDARRRLLSRRFDAVFSPDLNARSERDGAGANPVLPAANPAHIRHKEANHSMRADAGVNAKPRGPPAPGRVICPFRLPAFRQAGCIRNPAGQASGRKQAGFAEGPAATG